MDNSHKWLTLADLKAIASSGSEWDYNAQLEPALVESATDERYSVLAAIQHKHKQGQPCEPHMRCAIVINGELRTVDVPMDVWDRLPADGDPTPAPMQFRLRTLLIVLAILPPLLWIGWLRALQLVR